ncbi:hypothetical protein DPMN_043285 [Dreissena polymorpha]|uniref:Uncharacterized protein n=1 Tax=Dreissena polymorpha TaxID=45954 RepID=A0A9D4D0P5_DREPO|nr:hypothetical protein DPMN_043285 [Dreissena polymorpha]
MFVLVLLEQIHYNNLSAGSYRGGNHFKSAGTYWGGNHYKSAGSYRGGNHYKSAGTYWGGYQCKFASLCFMKVLTLTVTTVRHLVCIVCLVVLQDEITVLGTIFN